MTEKNTLPEQGILLFILECYGFTVISTGQNLLHTFSINFSRIRTSAGIDHLAYYTFDTLRFVLAEAGFEVLEEEMVNRDTLSVVVRKRPVTEGVEMEVRTAGKTEDADHVGEDSEICGISSAIAGFAESRQELNLEVDRILNQFDETGRTLAIDPFTMV